jgi:hypothetical protein
VEARGLSAAAPPWRAPWQTTLTALAGAAPLLQIELLNQQARARNLRVASGAPLTFVAAADAGDAPYEAHVFATGRVPTRSNRHDLYNALVWLHLPQAKAALNARQAAAIARDGVQPARGCERDALTLIDENGLALVADDPAVFDALAAHDWHWLFARERTRWHRRIVPQVIGHALLDKLDEPYKAITAHVVALSVPLGVALGSDADNIDGWLAAEIATGDLTPRPLLPMPVLGIPGWWTDNAQPAFYDDPAVFRPTRRAA